MSRDSAHKNPTAEGAAGLDKTTSLPRRNDRPSNSPEIAPAQGKKRGGRASRQKGIVRLLQDRGFGAEKIPLSGSACGSYAGDLTVPILGRDLVVECKARAKGFSQIYSWLQDRDALIAKSDRRGAIAILPLRLAAEIAIAAERRKP